MEDKIIEIKDTTDVVLSDKDLTAFSMFVCAGVTVIFGLMSVYLMKNYVNLTKSENKEEDI